MVDGRISGVRIFKFRIRGIPRPQLLDPQTVDRVRKQQQLMSKNDCVLAYIGGNDYGWTRLLCY